MTRIRIVMTTTRHIGYEDEINIQLWVKTS
jgi:hypothetical protein